MKLKFIFAASLFAISGFAIADAYQAEVGALASHWKSDREEGSLDQYEINGKYYVKPVRTDGLPLAEAAYLGKNTNIFAAHSRSNGDTSVNNRFTSAGVEVYIPENFTYVKVEGIHSRYDHSSSDNFAVVTLGLTPVDGLLVTTDWNSDESYHANIAAKYVTEITGDYFINLEVNVTHTDYGTYRAIGGDFYFDNTFSLGADLGDSDLGNDYTVRTRKFFSGQLSGSLAYTDADYGNEFTAGVNYRF